MTIEEFIEARLAEDEAIANAAGVGDRARWEYFPDNGSDERANVAHGEVYAPDATRTYAYTVDGGRQVEGIECAYITMDHEGILPSVEPEQAHHIARHDPDRALREVAAHRDLLDFYAEVRRVWQRDYLKADLVLGKLATIWSDHPDYRPEWAPVAVP